MEGFKEARLNFICVCAGWLSRASAGNVTSVLEFMRLRHGKVHLNAAPFTVQDLGKSCLNLVLSGALVIFSLLDLNATNKVV